jgi:hypothetical protein
MLGAGQPFTAPEVSPEMNSFWSSRKKHITGAIEISVPDMISPKSVA